MHTKIDKIEIMIGHETDKIIEELFESLLQRYQEGLEKSTRGSEFIFAGVDVLYYILSKLSPNPRDVIYRFSRIFSHSLVQRLEREICSRSVLGCGSGNK